MADTRASTGAETLHLIEAPRASGGGRESSLFAWNIQRSAGLIEPGAVTLIGDSMSERWMRAHGIVWDARIAPPTGRIALAWSPLVRLIRSRRPGSVRCWSLPTLRLASALARVHGAPIRATLVEAPGGDEKLIRRAAARVESIDVFDDEDASAWRGLGVECRVAGIDASAPDLAEAQDQARRRLQRGLGVGESELLLGTLFDHPSDTDFRRLSFLLCILAVSEHRTVGLAPAGARLIEAGRRYARVINRDYRLLFSGQPLIEQLRVLDACVIPDPTRRQARGSRRVLEHAAACAGVRAYERPEYTEVSGPTPPDMIRPMLEVLEGVA